jgi:hypothetical protein
MRILLIENLKIAFRLKQMMIINTYKKIKILNEFSNHKCFNNLIRLIKIL